MRIVQEYYRHNWCHTKTAQVAANDGSKPRGLHAVKSPKVTALLDNRPDVLASIKFSHRGFSSGFAQGVKQDETYFPLLSLAGHVETESDAVTAQGRGVTHLQSYLWNQPNRAHHSRC